MQQTHYLSKVMRLFAKMKKGNDPPLVRVFDGINGEWLCEIFTPPDDDTSDVNNDNQRKRRNRRDDILLQARCTHQLREQNTKILNLSSEDTSAYIPTSPWYEDFLDQVSYFLLDARHQVSSHQHPEYN